MNCSQAQVCLQDRLDGLAIADPLALETHLAGCVDCRQLHAASGRLLAGLQLMKRPALSPSLQAAIIHEVLADRDSRQTFRRRLVAVCAVAAGLLLALATLFPLWKGQGPAVVVTVPAPLKTPETRVMVARKPSLRGSFADAGFAFASLTRRTADETVGQTRLLMPESVPTPLPVPEPAPALETNVLSNAGQGMSAGLEPIANSARRAFSMLLRESGDEKR